MNLPAYSTRWLVCLLCTALQGAHHTILRSAEFIYKVITK